MVGATVERKNEKVKLSDVEHHLIYVLKRNEGAITQYYILPEFNYNDYRKDFMNATDIKRYNEFFSDSRKLFSEHNKGTTEMIVQNDSPTGKLYSKLLTGYYSVEIASTRFALLHDENIGQVLHKTVDKNGKEHFLSGVCESVEKATGVKNFINDLHIADQIQIVFVTNEGTTVLPL